MAQAYEDDELEQLADLLESDAMPATAMNLSTLDGFFTAAALVPRPMPWRELLPWVWDDESAEPGSGEVPATPLDSPLAQRLEALLRLHWDGLLDTLRSSPEDYEPVLYLVEPEQGGEPQPAIDDWCWGFVTGMQLHAQQYEALPDELQELLGPILLYGTEQGWEHLDSQPLSDDEYEQVVEALPGIVAELARYFGEQG